MAISADMIKRLREETGAGVIDCKKALEKSKGDFEEARKILKEKGIEIAQKKSDRRTKEGRIESYIHHNHKVGSVVEVNCETDFVARNEEFVKFCKDIALHIVASAPKFLKKEDVLEKDIPKEENKEEFYKKFCLLEQKFVRDESITVGEYLFSLIAKTRENVVISKFSRFQVGEIASVAVESTR